jgi:hypothetical protein
MTAKKAGTIFLWVIGASGVLSMSLLAATSKSTRNVEPKALVEVENPNQYFYGTVKSGDVFRNGDDLFTAIDVHPFSTSVMFDKQITFCNNVERQFAKLTMQDTVVITYSKLSRSKLCFDLVAVDVVEKKN